MALVIDEGQGPNADDTRECDIDELNKLLDDLEDDDSMPDNVDENSPSLQQENHTSISQQGPDSAIDSEDIKLEYHTWTEERLRDEVSVLKRKIQLIENIINERRQAMVTDKVTIINKSCHMTNKVPSQQQEKYSENVNSRHKVDKVNRTKLHESSAFAEDLMSKTSSVASSKSGSSHQDAASLVHTGESSDEEFMDEYGLTLSRSSADGAHSQYKEASRPSFRQQVAPAAKPDSDDCNGEVGSRRIAHQPSDQHSQDVVKRREILRDKLSKERAEAAKQDNVPFFKEPKTGLVIKNPLVASNVLQERMQGRKICKLSVLDSCMFNGKISGDWITLAAIVERTETKQSAKGNKYMIWKLSDLLSETKTVSFFLFKEVYEKYWKLDYGMVVGLLNATVMEQQQGKGKFGSAAAGRGKSSELALTVDHPGQILVVGEARDLTRCQAMCKSGERCKNFANKQTGATCVYHLTSRVKTLANRRGELNTTLSSIAPKSFDVKYRDTSRSGDFKHQGQFYTSAPLNQLTEDERSSKSHTRTDIKLPADINDTLNKWKKKISEKKVDTAKMTSNVLSASALLNKHKNETKTTPKENGVQLRKGLPSTPQLGKGLPSTPQLGKGLPSVNAESRSISLDMSDSPQLQQRRQLSATASKQKTPTSAAAALKMQKAINKIKSSGGGRLERQDPNSVVSRQPTQGKRVCGDPVDGGHQGEPPPSQQPERKRSKLGELNMSAEQMERIINSRSAHDDQFEQAEREKLGEYLNTLERKDEVEQRLTTLTELPCKVVICAQCKYTALSQGEECRKLGHRVAVRKDGRKRFYRCAQCKQRVVTVDRYPADECRKCGSTKYEKTSVMKERSGSCQERDVLLTRGEEKTFVNSTPSQFAPL